MPDRLDDCAIIAQGYLVFAGRSDSEDAADPFGCPELDLGVTWNGCLVTITGIQPYIVFSPVVMQKAPVMTKVLFERSAFHSRALPAL